MKLYLLVGLFCFACGHKSGDATGDGAAGGGGDGANPNCFADSTSCTTNLDCCSGRCEGNTCLPSGSCKAPGATCTDGPTNDCCSGRCEPVQGMAGVTQCLAICNGNGAGCTKATDCCDLNCNAGHCGGAECKVESENCTSNTQCCSNICTAGQCQLDMANTTCRGLGETCNSGPQQGCCSMVCDDTQDPPRCDFGAGTCKAQNATCATDADCCHGICDPTRHTCQTPCTANAGTCTTAADCCSSICTNGSCSPTPPNCTAIGTTCTSNATCCSGLCLGGFCDSIQ